MAAEKKANVAGVPIPLAEAVREIAEDYENWVSQEIIDATADAGQRLQALVKEYGEEVVKRAAEAHGALDIEMPDPDLTVHLD